jgi:hypothetical protein
MKISNFKKFHKNRVYENTIMEPVEDVTVNAGQPAQDQKSTQAQKSMAQAQRAKQAQMPKVEEVSGNLKELAQLLGVTDYTGSNVLYYTGVDESGKDKTVEIEQYSENDHFAVDGVDIKTTNSQKAKEYVDTIVKPKVPTKPVIPTQPKETPSQEPVKTPAKAMQESRKVFKKNRINELNDPRLISGGLNIGGGHGVKGTQELLMKSQEVSAMEPIDKYLHFINQLSKSKTDTNAIEMILHNCYIELAKTK